MENGRLVRGGEKRKEASAENIQMGF